jgi:hypothetical protein
MRGQEEAFRPRNPMYIRYRRRIDYSLLRLQ